MTAITEETRLLDAAESLFYEYGYQSVGMDRLRADAGLSLKRIYALHGSKDALIVAMLDRRDDQWHAALAARVDQHQDPRDRVLAVFEWLADWLAGAGHRGCAWINAFGELGGVSPAVVEAVRAHKMRFRRYVEQLVLAAGGTSEDVDAIVLLAEGAMVTAGIHADPSQAQRAGRAAARLLPSTD